MKAQQAVSAYYGVEAGLQEMFEFFDDRGIHVDINVCFTAEGVRYTWGIWYDNDGEVDLELGNSGYESRIVALGRAFEKAYELCG